MTLTFATVLLLVTLFVSCHCSGKYTFPCSMQVSMAPEDGQPQFIDENPPPYSFYVLNSKNEIAKNYSQEEYTIVLNGTAYFRRFLIQARPSSSSGTLTTNARAGQFVVEPNEWDQQGVEIMRCPSAISDSITHANNHKKSSIKVKWITKRNDGPIQFLITVVQDSKLYWVQWSPKSGLLFPDVNGNFSGSSGHKKDSSSSETSSEETSKEQSTRNNETINFSNITSGTTVQSSSERAHDNSTSIAPAPLITNGSGSSEQHSSEDATSMNLTSTNSSSTIDEATSFRTSTASTVKAESKESSAESELKSANQTAFNESTHAATNSDSTHRTTFTTSSVLANSTSNGTTSGEVHFAEEFNKEPNSTDNRASFTQWESGNHTSLSNVSWVLVNGTMENMNVTQSDSLNRTKIELNTIESVSAIENSTALVNTTISEKPANATDKSTEKSSERGSDVEFDSKVDAENVTLALSLKEPFDLSLESSGNRTNNLSEVVDTTSEPENVSDSSLHEHFSNVTEFVAIKHGNSSESSVEAFHNESTILTEISTLSSLNETFSELFSMSSNSTQEDLTTNTPEVKTTAKAKNSPCSFAMCLNDGLCVAMFDGNYTCECSVDWVGDYCEKPNFCGINLCQNGGICQNGDHGHSCLCSEGHFGKSCEHHCRKNSCKNNGSCFFDEISNKVVCSCQPGFTGDECEIANPCASNPCMNQGTCVSRTFGYICLCPAGYMGQRCHRPCQDAYKSCKLWQEEDKCTAMRPLTKFFDINCASTCNQCTFDNSTIRTLNPLPEVLEPFHSLLGTWLTNSTTSERFPMDFPNAPQGYYEELSFLITTLPEFGTPSINYTVYAVNNADRFDVQKNVGFMTLKPFSEPTNVSIISTGNDALTIIEEGLLTGTEMNLTSNIFHVNSFLRNVPKEVEFFLFHFHTNRFKTEIGIQLQRILSFNGDSLEENVKRLNSRGEWESFVKVYRRLTPYIVY